MSETIETMGAKEVMDYLGISRATLHRRIAAGELTPLPKAPGQKKAHRLAFNKADVEKLVAIDGQS